jgi:muramoyltetrapeptide carboxypeptidase
MQKPKKLKKGDTIAIIAPSAGLYFSHRLDNAIISLKSLGYKIKEFPSARKVEGWESAPSKERAKDIMAAFLDTKITAIIALTGGTVANQTLRYLDFEKIKQNPKIFCGYSDNSVLHYAFYTQSDLVTFYGPCIATQFGEYPKLLEYTLEYFDKALTTTEPIGKVSPSQNWTDEILDWSKKLDLTRPRRLKRNNGFEWLRNGRAKGKIIGGCLESVVHLPGTRYWPDYKGKILFLELSEGQIFGEGDPLAYVDGYLEQLNILGVFSQIKGLIFGRPYNYSDGDTKLLKRKLLERTKEYGFPILYGADIGHTDPQITIPIGVEVVIDSEANTFDFLESGVK